MRSITFRHDGRVLSYNRHELQLYPRSLPINVRLIFAFAVNFAVWGGLASFMWSR